MNLYCPQHGTPLDGGPPTYTCRHGHNVKADDATTESGRPQL